LARKLKNRVNQFIATSLAFLHYANGPCGIPLA
jgi:hypothetical protein